MEFPEKQRAVRSNFKNLAHFESKLERDALLSPDITEIHLIGTYLDIRSGWRGVSALLEKKVSSNVFHLQNEPDQRGFQHHSTEKQVRDVMGASRATNRDNLTLSRRGEVQKDTRTDFCAPSILLPNLWKYFVACSGNSMHLHHIFPNGC